jgi:citronellol/citronellal dehydrogenase
MSAPTRADLRGQVAIVTGASRGIGRCIAVSLGRAGMTVAVAAKTVRAREQLPGTIGETAAAVEAAGGRALAIATDVRDADALEGLVAATVAAFGRVDLLVNNAGALWWRPALETPARRFDLVMSVNVRAAFLLSRQVALAMRQGGRGGHIIMLSPPLDPGPHPGMVAYSISISE